MSQSSATPRYLLVGQGTPGYLVHENPGGADPKRWRAQWWSGTNGGTRNDFTSQENAARWAQTSLARFR